MKQQSLKRYSALLAVSMSAGILTGCAARSAPGVVPQPGSFNVYSKDQDIEIGRQAAAEVSKQVKVVENRELQTYISSLGGQLARRSEASDYPYSFTMIHDDSINAFALPGGPIFINSGTVKNAANEAQLAGVLAHEISHVALRHGTSQASKASIADLAAQLAGAVIGQESAAGQLGQLGLSVGLTGVLLKYSRDAEREADKLGVHIMAGAGYDPMQMALFFKALEDSGGSRAPEFLSSHPNPGNRVQLVAQETEFIPNRSYTAQTGRFQEAKRLVGQLPPAPRPNAE